jgi:hypothetical protein
MPIEDTAHYVEYKDFPDEPHTFDSNEANLLQKRIGAYVDENAGGGGGGGGGGTLDATVMRSVVHGNVASTARPASVNVVVWVGAAEPTNAANNDIWIPIPA